jgi:hypothetical protein
MPFYIFGYRYAPNRKPKCKAGHFSLCTKKPNCNTCALLQLNKKEVLNERN